MILCSIPRHFHFLNWSLFWEIEKIVDEGSCWWAILPPSDL